MPLKLWKQITAHAPIDRKGGDDNYQHITKAEILERSSAQAEASGLMNTPSIENIVVGLLPRQTHAGGCSPGV